MTEARTTHYNAITFPVTQRACPPPYLRCGLRNFADGLHSPQFPVAVLTHKHRWQADIVVGQVSLQEKNRKRLPLEFVKLKF